MPERGSADWWHVFVCLTLWEFNIVTFSTASAYRKDICESNIVLRNFVVSEYFSSAVFLIIHEPTKLDSSVTSDTIISDSREGADVY